MSLPTAAEMTALPADLRAQIARRSRNKGSNYEREVAKKIANYFAEPWGSCFFRTKPHGMAQPNGDLQPINNMSDRWRGAKLGPLECKNRALWSFDQLYKNPAKSELYRYWVKSNEDCKSDNTIVFFTKNGVSDLVLLLTHNLTVEGSATVVYVTIETHKFMIITLQSFLTFMWPK